MTCVECVVSVKYSESKVTNKYLHYDPFVLDPENQTVRAMVQETLDKIKPEDGDDRPSIVLKTTMVIQ